MAEAEGRLRTASVNSWYLLPFLLRLSLFFFFISGFFSFYVRLFSLQLLRVKRRRKSRVVLYHRDLHTRPLLPLLIFNLKQFSDHVIKTPAVIYGRSLYPLFLFCFCFRFSLSYFLSLFNYFISSLAERKRKIFSCS